MRMTRATVIDRIAGRLARVGFAVGGGYLFVRIATGLLGGGE